MLARLPFLRRKVLCGGEASVSSAFCCILLCLGFSISWFFELLKSHEETQCTLEFVRFKYPTQISIEKQVNQEIAARRLSLRGHFDVRSPSFPVLEPTRIVRNLSGLLDFMRPLLLPLGCPIMSGQRIQQNCPILLNTNVR